MSDDIAEPADVPSGTSSKPIIVVSVILLVIIAAFVLVVASVRDSTPTFERVDAFERGDAVERPEGAPGGDAFVVLSEPEVSADDLSAILFDLGRPGSVVRQDTVEFLARATSAFGQTELLRWQEDNTPPSGGEQRLLRCDAHLTNYGSSGSGGSACNDAEDPWDSPSMSHGTSVADDESLGRVTLFDVPAQARWMVVATGLNDLVVANVVNNVSHVDWSINERGDLRSIALLDESSAEVWFDDGPFNN